VIVSSLDENMTFILTFCVIGAWKPSGWNEAIEKVAPHLIKKLIGRAPVEFETVAVLFCRNRKAG
jgi:hypothetical protein